MDLPLNVLPQIPKANCLSIGESLHRLREFRISLAHLPGQGPELRRELFDHWPRTLALVLNVCCCTLEKSLVGGALAFLSDLTQGLRTFIEAGIPGMHLLNHVARRADAVPVAAVPDSCIGIFFDEVCFVLHNRIEIAARSLEGRSQSARCTDFLTRIVQNLGTESLQKR